MWPLAVPQMQGRGQQVFVVKPTFNNNLQESVTGMKVPVGQGLGLCERAANNPDHPIPFLVKDERAEVTKLLAAEGVHFLGTIRVLEAAPGRPVVVDLPSSMNRVLDLICTANDLPDFRQYFATIQLEAATAMLRSGLAPGSVAMRAARARQNSALRAILQYQAEQGGQGNLRLGGGARSIDLYYVMHLAYCNPNALHGQQGTLVLKLSATKTPGLDWVRSLAGGWFCGHGRAGCCDVEAPPAMLRPVSSLCLNVWQCIFSCLVACQLLLPRMVASGVIMPRMLSLQNGIADGADQLVPISLYVC
jgi:hypothetical protein